MQKLLFVQRIAAVAVSVVMLGCGESGGPAKHAAPENAAPVEATGSDVLATVNGVPIRLSELHYVLARRDKGRGRGADAAHARAALEELIDQEVARQAAHAEKLDADPEYIKKLRFMEAPFIQFQREELSDRYTRRALLANATVSDADIQAYFEQHRVELGTTLHVEQILVRHDEAKIRALRQQIVDGAAFDKTAATLFPELPEGMKPPWDLGFLRLSQLPEQWRGPVDALKEGEVSDVIVGPNERFWIVKLLERKVDSSVTLDQVKPEITALLQARKTTAVRATTRANLRKQAKVQLVREPGPMAPPSDPGD